MRISSTMSKATTTILITGGYGFIGSHVAKRLYDHSDGYHIRIIDLVSKPPPSMGTICHEFIQGNLCDLSTCIAAVKGAATILHFAANMGGMGTIHADNEAEIYAQNHTMTQNILKAASLPDSTVTKFFYASSACVYPEVLQSGKDISLRESDVFPSDGTIPRPQGLYGLEKLNSELLMAQYTEKFDIRIARFHNIYGPGGSWNNGREKAPAALLRKALVCRRLNESTQETFDFEIWGDGTQRRSFLFIDDAVDGILRLLSSSYSRPLNIGSDQAVTIRELAELALKCAGTQGPLAWLRETQTTMSPRLSSDGPVYSFGGRDEEDVAARFRGGQVSSGLRRSKVVDLEADRLTFAIILPITSRGLPNPNECLENLRKFIQSLQETTWRDVHSSSDQHFRFVIYLAIDADDSFLLQENKARQLIIDLGIPSSQIREVINSEHPKGHVCAIWRDCARQAHSDGCDYFVLMGDDVTLLDEGWMRKCHSTFSSLAEATGLPFGLGCVSFTDVSFPGMPTFPIVHKTHMEVFGGEVVPSIFINQDGDPFLFQLYRRWGTSVMFPCRLRNEIGGSVEARYTKKHAANWSLAPLVRAEQAVANYLEISKGFAASHIADIQKLTLDVIVPCYRVDLYSSNRVFVFGGLAESSAEWVHFLDDDIVPSRDLLFAISDAIRENPDAAGFVCNTQFPIADSVFTTAVHLSGVTYFWVIATKIPTDIPWGVTANLVSHRVLVPSDFATKGEIPSPTTYSLSYPKTGGGEDIDYCLTQRATHLSIRQRNPNATGRYPGFLPAPTAIVTHPWWNNGKRSYWRFHKWSLGDGHLINVYPELSYRDYAPNSAECFLLCLTAVLSGAITLSHYDGPSVSRVLCASLLRMWP
ncbi:hypothetical protein D9756_009659 [Leucocoprinus leucothites]|uniref:NAD-dependent epimerase/dehydratase domain-containing protein n=1 Tax=Leucocoprinus leucothites TaxID=201217 RepID=A0A8H5CVD2_9AGAR|nr:hypothetical protein D9756_009659 [Leucoagaricus leucothites]